MPTFATPEPISVTVELALGDVQIVASDRADTVVKIRPGNAAKKADVEAAEQIRVDFDNGNLSIKGPRNRKLTFWGGYESVQVEIALPEGSHLRGHAGAGALRSTGRLGECRYKVGAGKIHLDQAGSVQLTTGAGDVVVDRSVREADVTTGSGAVRIERIEGAANIKNLNGDTWIGEALGNLNVKAANGKISVGRMSAAVVAKTANGDINVREVVHGSVVAHTAFGAITVGIREGVAAWLDLNTHFGKVRNDLGAAERPAPGEDTVEVQARTAFGDVTVLRPEALPGLAL